MDKISNHSNADCGSSQSRKVKIQLELTARRSKLLKHAKGKVAASTTFEFAFVDINCRLGLKTKDGSYFF